MEECINSNSVGSHAVFNFCFSNKIKLIYSATSASIGNKGSDKDLSPYAFSKAKNLERKLDNFAKEAKNELNNVCGSSLWESLVFVFFDQLEDSEKIAKANFYYGQLQIINEIKFSI